MLAVIKYRAIRGHTELVPKSASHARRLRQNIVKPVGIRPIFREFDAIRRLRCGPKNAPDPPPNVRAPFERR